MASSSAKKPHNNHLLHHHHDLPTPQGTTAAPPPTPSTQTNLSPDFNADALTRLLHRLPPSLSLSLPTRRSSPLPSTTTATDPPLISLHSLRSKILSAAEQHGFFELTHHPIPSDLPVSAESAALSLFNLPSDSKQNLFPANWPLGYDWPENNENDDSIESFCLNSSCSTESADIGTAPLREFTGEMEKLGLKVLEELASVIGFKNPVRDDPSRLCSYLWVSNGQNKPGCMGRVYPYVIGLHYQMRSKKYSLLSDSGWVNVSPHVHSVLVTLGDIAQVWSNGRSRKVRGRPVYCLEDNNNDSHCISISLLVTLPLESTVSPQIRKLPSADDINSQENEDPGADSDTNGEEEQFTSFSFEDYAWRVYHEPLLLKDPLVRYRL